MKTRLSLALFVLTIALMSGCSSGVTVVKPYETSVDHIFRLKTGMTLNQVSTTLNCQPHQFYFDGSTGCKVVEYRYRRKYHERNKEDQVHYRDEGMLYALFFQDKLREIITSSGQQKSIQLLIDELNIRAACSYDGTTGNAEAIRQRYLQKK